MEKGFFTLPGIFLGSVIDEVTFWEKNGRYYYQYSSLDKRIRRCSEKVYKNMKKYHEQRQGIKEVTHE